MCLFFCQTVFVWGYVSVTLVLVLLSDRGQVFVWGYGILGKGPEVGHSDVPTMIPEPLFGRNEVQPDTTVVDIECGLGHFVALTGKLKRDKKNSVVILLDTTVVDMECGLGHFVALTGKLKRDKKNSAVIMLLYLHMKRDGSYCDSHISGDCVIVYEELNLWLSVAVSHSKKCHTAF